MNTQRDGNGLLIGINYIKNEDGSINWRAMVPKEYLVPNKQYFEKFNKPVPTSIEGLPDKELLILLAGVKALCSLAGARSIKYPVVQSSPEHCSVVCEIEWISDVNVMAKITSGLGDATASNTNSFAKYYLAPIAENRAFVRCIRSALGLTNLLGADEIGQTPKEEPKTNNAVEKSRETLKKLMAKFDYTLEDLTKKLVATGHKDAAKYKDINEVPPNLVLEAVGILKEIK